ncbi:hypothetical protein TELCIR_10109 [Teladorsagia circumcincta]|uniref:Uncharacterized protein n=1 Tax=Teladorsagia circumcincta TaxID=45464 RepID=A0A2G9UD01_TELCI|nr:hypothetical protein TELCIR_10109 [Teladorsagia circumcincta]
MYAERPWTTCENEAKFSAAKPTTPVFSTYQDQTAFQEQVNAYHLFPPSTLRKPVPQKTSVSGPPIESSYLIDIPSYTAKYYMGNGPATGNILDKELDNNDVYPQAHRYQVSPMMIEQSHQAPKCLAKNIFVATPDGDPVSPLTPLQEAVTPKMNSTEAEIVLAESTTPRGSPQPQHSPTDVKYISPMESKYLGMPNDLYNAYSTVPQMFPETIVSNVKQNPNEIQTVFASPVQADQQPLEKVNEGASQNKG